MIALTVLMPVYNGLEFVDEQIKSILNQSINVKFIILDDCSTDGSYDYLFSQYNNDINITVLQNEKNLGVVKSVEKLLGLVDTDYFCLADQDDVWKKSKLQMSFDHIKKTKANLVYTDLIVVDKVLNQIHPSMWNFSNIYAVSGRDFVPLIVKNSVTGCTIVGDRELIKAALPFPEGVAMHDRWLALVASTLNGISALNEPLIYYRQHGGNQLGSSSFGFFGFINRVKSFGKGNVRNYIYRRDIERCGFIDALSTRLPNNEELKFLREFYSSPPAKRFLNIFRYLKMMLKRKSLIGFKNIFSDLVTSLFFGQKL